MNNFNDSIGNRTRDLPTCSAVPQRLSTVTALYMTVFNTKHFHVLSVEFSYFFIVDLTTRTRHFPDLFL